LRLTLASRVSLWRSREKIASESAAERSAGVVLLKAPGSAVPMQRFATYRRLTLLVTLVGLFTGGPACLTGQAGHPWLRRVSSWKQVRRQAAAPIPPAHRPAPTKPTPSQGRNENGGHAQQNAQNVAPKVEAAPQMQRHAVIERREVPAPNVSRVAPRAGAHLSEWMNQHSNLTPAQQQQALENEPGFRELPSVTQERLRDQLAKLNAMPPQQRARWTANTEAMERLTPDQRAQVRGALQQAAALPPPQRGVVERNFRQLRELPADQREEVMNSERYRAQMNDAQRAALSNLLHIEPMLPPPEPREAPATPK
jgi:hypothetical protein